MSFRELNLEPNNEVDLDNLITSSIRIHPSPGYHELTVKQQIQQLEDEYKEEYIKPDRVPYNKNMARHFPNATITSMEEVNKKRVQAEASRLSRDRNKYYRLRMEQDIEILTKVLEGNMKRLANIENFANDFFEKNNLAPFDWLDIWCDEIPEPNMDGQVVDSGCSSGTGSDRNTESDEYDDDDDDDDDDDTCIDDDNRSEEEEDEEERRSEDTDEYMDDDEGDNRCYTSDSSTDTTLLLRLLQANGIGIGNEVNKNNMNMFQQM